MEFVYMTEVGMSPAEAIRSATRSTAELLGVADEGGVLAADHWADIIAVEGNPLDDVAVLQQVDFVMKSGEIYKRSDPSA
jgi:imidazolonepropionase-like amidohydrolase